LFFFSSRRRHTRSKRDWSSDVCSSDLLFTFASQVDKENVWQFVISDQDLGTSTSRVEIVNTTSNYRGWRSRLRAEFTVGRQAVRSEERRVGKGVGVGGRGMRTREG